MKKTLAGVSAALCGVAFAAGLPEAEFRDPSVANRPDVEGIVAQYPDQFAVEFARGVVWGMQPMVHNFTMKDVENPRIAHDIQYMKDTAKFYHAHREFLFDGTLLKPAKLTCATKRAAFLSAGCYTRPQDGKVVVQKALPTVLHSEWRARDGREAAVLANWTMEPQTYRLDFGGGKTVSGTLAAREWRLVNQPHAYWDLETTKTTLPSLRDRFSSHANGIFDIMCGDETDSHRYARLPVHTAGRVHLR